VHRGPRVAAGLQPPVCLAERVAEARDPAARPADPRRLLPAAVGLGDLLPSAGRRDGLPGREPPATARRLAGPAGDAVGHQVGPGPARFARRIAGVGRVRDPQPAGPGAGRPRTAAGPGVRLRPVDGAPAVNPGAASDILMSAICDDWVPRVVLNPWHP